MEVRSRRGAIDDEESLFGLLVKPQLFEWISNRRACLPYSVSVGPSTDLLEAIVSIAEEAGVEF